MARLKQQGLVKKIGVSVYNNQQIDYVLDNFSIDLIQLPINILDQRLINDESLVKLKKHNVEIHARSALLQGLLLMSINTIPYWFDTPPKNWTLNLTIWEFSMTRQYTAYTKEFKLETIRLASQSNTCIAQLARDLGLRRNMIYKWRDQLNLKQDKAFKRTATNEQVDRHKATHADLLKENKRLSKELKLAQMEAEILKKAQAYFEDQNS